MDAVALGFTQMKQHVEFTRHSRVDIRKYFL